MLYQSPSLSSSWIRAKFSIKVKQWNNWCTELENAGKKILAPLETSVIMTWRQMLKRTKIQLFHLSVCLLFRWPLVFLFGVAPLFFWEDFLGVSVVPLAPFGVSKLSFCCDGVDLLSGLGAEFISIFWRNSARSSWESDAKQTWSLFGPSSDTCRSSGSLLFFLLSNFMPSPPRITFVDSRLFFFILSILSFRTVMYGCVVRTHSVFSGRSINSARSLSTGNPMALPLA